MQPRHVQGPCHELLDQLSNYIDGELEAALCAEVETHLAQCPDCRIIVDTVRKVIRVYRAESANKLPDDVEERLYRVLELR